MFYYLSEEEAADVYLYLTLYPPSESASLDTTIALSQQDPPAGGGTPPPQKILSASLVPANQPMEVQKPDTGPDLQTVAVLSGVGLFIVLLLAGGLGFTVHEFKRLSAKELRLQHDCEHNTQGEDRGCYSNLSPRFLS